MRTPAEVTNAQGLLEALDGRHGDRAQLAEFDRAIWERCGAEGAILVTDLSGFTRITKHHGILHFLAIFRRCQRTCLPLIPEHGGQLLKQEADDFITIFPDAAQAMACAVAMLGATAALNRTLEEDDRIYMCIGIEFGRLLRLEDDAFGDPVNVAYKLGEDVAEPGEILIGDSAHARAVRDGFDFSALAGSGPRTITAGNVELPHYSYRLRARD